MMQSDGATASRPPAEHQGPAKRGWQREEMEFDTIKHRLFVTFVLETCKK